MSKFKWLIVVINVPRFLLHIFFYEIFRKKCQVDVQVGMFHHGVRGPLWCGFLFLMTFDKPFRNLFYHRIGGFKYLIYYWAPPHNSFVIATYSRIAEGFLGVHPIGTFVNASCVGKYFTVKNNVTIGNNGEGNPEIGDYVTINANAVVVGKIKLGNHVEVGAGTVLMKNVPDNCVVVGNPAYILKENGIRVNKKL